MTRPIRPIDLGHKLFQVLPLRLLFGATANFTEVVTGPSSRSTINFSQWTDLQTLWIFQAPRLELRLFIDFDPMIKAAGSRFAVSLVKDFCRSKVWTDLGFDIALKYSTKSGDSTCLVFGLCRTNKLPASTHSTNRPRILRDPREAHPPSEVRTACLASVDIHLEYTSCDATRQLEMCLLRKCLDLLDFGLQRLFLPTISQNPNIKALRKGRLQNLSSLVPAVFEPTYREGMNQRAISLPKISMSLISMLENKADLQGKLAARLIKLTDLDGSLTPELAHGDTRPTRFADCLKSMTELLQWNIARYRLARMKARKKPSPFFTPHAQSSEPSLHLDDDDIILPPSSDQELGSDDDDDDNDDELGERGQNVSDLPGELLNDQIPHLPAQNR